MYRFYASSSLPSKPTANLLSRRWFRIGSLAVTAVFCLTLMPVGSPAQAAACPVADPIDSPIFRAFNEYVQSTYRPARKGSTRSPEIRFQLAYGHALGRLASAVKNNRSRKVAFDCVQKALDQLAHRRYGVVYGATVTRGLRQAAFGMEDGAVASEYGVTAATPLEGVFRRAEASVARRPPPPKRPPSPTASGAGRSPTFSPTAGGSAGSGRGNCVRGDRWSLQQAQRHFQNANAMRRQLESRFGRKAACTGSSWELCTGIKRELANARDHINQVFEQNFDARNGCKRCSFSAALANANILRGWVSWSRGRNMNIGAMVNTQSIIASRLNVPNCGAPTRVTTGPPGGAKSPAPGGSPPRPGIRDGADRCLDRNYRPSADITSYTFYGGGSWSQPLKGSFWCQRSGYARVTGSSITHYKCEKDKSGTRYIDCRQTLVERVLERKVDAGKTTYVIRKTPNHKKKRYVVTLRSVIKR